MRNLTTRRIAKSELLSMWTPIGANKVRVLKKMCAKKSPLRACIVNSVKLVSECAQASDEMVAAIRKPFRKEA